MQYCHSQLAGFCLQFRVLLVKLLTDHICNSLGKLFHKSRCHIFIHIALIYPVSLVVDIGQPDFPAVVVHVRNFFIGDILP